MEKLNWLEKQIANELGNWIVDGTAVKGWYTCVVTGKKFRGQDAIAQLELQAQKLEERQEELDKAIQGDIQMEIDMDDELSDEVQAEALKSIKGKGKAQKGIGEGAEKDKKPKAKAKVKTLGEVQEKYPHVKRIITFELSEDEVGENAGNIASTIQSAVDTSNWTEKLFNWVESEVLKGRTSYIFYEIECQHCNNTHRTIKPQDAFQVRYCEPCAHEWRKANRRNNRKKSKGE